MNHAKISGPCAWRASDFGGRPPLTPVPEAVLSRIDALVTSEAVRSAPLERLGVDELADPEIDEFMRSCREEILRGRGFVLLDGVDAGRYDEEQMARIFWLLGQRLGDPVSQSAAGQMLGRVQDRPDMGPSGRGYQSRQVLPMHTDGGDYMGLMCVRPAKAGGMSVVSSIATVYNAFVDQAPHLLPILFRGFHYHRKDEQAQGTGPFTPYRVPVFAHTPMGLLSHYVRASIDLYARDFEPLSPLEVEALDTFDRLAEAPEHCLDFYMAPGQMYICNNPGTLHSRTSFDDWDTPGRKRLLYRLWLQGRPRWDAPATLYVYENQDGRAGVDPKAGGKPAGSKYFINYEGKVRFDAPAQPSQPSQTA